MGLKDRKKIKLKQKNKRHKKRRKLIAEGQDPDHFWHGKYYVGTKHSG